MRADRPESKDERKSLVTTALESGIEKIIIRKEDQEFMELGRFQVVVKDGDDLTCGDEIGRLMEISTPQEQELALRMVGKVDFLVASPSDWKIIPLENLIAAFQKSDTSLMACASNPTDAAVFRDTLETGVDGIVIDVSDPKMLKDFRISTGISLHDLESAEVIEVRSLGMGDRVCIDTCSMMEPGEGMLIGSQSACLFHVQSESESSGYVAPRPFRVNAGAVHAYILTPGGKTRYLSEIVSGDTVMIVRQDGTSREGIVGRCKIEKRPLLLIRARAAGKEHSTILQNAETVRLCTPDGSVSVSEIVPGDKVLVKAEKGGRHFGMSVEESIREL